MKPASPPRPQPAAPAAQKTLADVKFKPVSPPPPRSTHPAPASPASPGAAASAGIDGADVDPATLSELPPAVRADIERQLALWRKSRRSAPARRPPPKKPKTARRLPRGAGTGARGPATDASRRARRGPDHVDGFLAERALAALGQANGDVPRALERPCRECCKTRNTALAPISSA